MGKFDPLHKWLGIAPHEQPPDHYRLLGLTRFESDPDVIDSAADRQLSFLHGMINGRHGKHAEELSNQVSAARLCLLKPERREAYEASLRSKDPELDPAIVSSPPTRDSTGAGWRVAHGDGVPYGPFTWAEIERAADEGKFAEHTHLHHATETDGQWVAASTRIVASPQVSGTDASGRSPHVPVRVRGPRKRARQKKSFPWMAVVVPALVMGGLLIALIRSPKFHSQLGDKLLGRSPAVDTSDREPDQGSPTSTDSVPDGSPDPNASSDASTTLDSQVGPSNGSSGVPSSASVFTPVDSQADQNALDQAFGEMVSSGKMVSSGDSADTPTRSGSELTPNRERTVKVDLTTSRWVDLLPGVSETSTVRLVRLDAGSGAVANSVMDPTDGTIQFGPLTRVTLPECFQFTIETTLKSVDENIAELVCRAEWSFGTGKPHPFSLARLEKAEREAKRGVATAENLKRAADQQVAAAKATIANYRSRGKKRRADQLGPQLKVLQAQAGVAEKHLSQTQSNAVQWRQIHQTLLGLHQEGQLILEVQN